MVISILYQPSSEHSRSVEEYLHEFNSRNPDINVNLISADTVEGSNLARLYDIVRYPAVLAIQNNGSLAQSWVGDSLPLINEVAYFAVL